MTVITRWSGRTSPTRREAGCPPEHVRLEAEDADYWYMRAPGRSSCARSRKAQTESRNLRGGVAIGKYTTRSVPAAALHRRPGVLSAS